MTDGAPGRTILVAEDDPALRLRTLGEREALDILGSEADHGAWEPRIVRAFAEIRRELGASVPE